MSRYLANTEIFIALLYKNERSNEILDWLEVRDSEGLIQGSFASYAQILLSSYSKGNHEIWEKALSEASNHEMGPVEWSERINSMWGKLWRLAESLPKHKKLKLELLELVVYSTAIVEGYILVMDKESPLLAKIQEQFKLDYLVVE